MTIVTRGIILCILGCCVHVGWGDTLIAGGKFSQRIPAQGDGHAAMDPVDLFIDQHLTIYDIDVHLDITHTEVSDLRIELESPWGETVMLKDYWLVPWRNPKQHMRGTIFDDGGSVPMKVGNPPYQGRFQPAKGYFLSDLNDQDAYGSWTLRIYDDYLADFGTLDRWELHISHVPEPISLIYLLAGIVYAHRRSSPTPN